TEELERERALAEGAGTGFLYSGRCRERADVPEGSPFVVRLRLPEDDVTIVDLVRGEVVVESSTIDDFVLLRTDGNPTYHLSVVVDDIDMGITLVARGEDHLSNTPKHIHLFRAFGVEPPAFAHLPLILGPDKKRLSKRTGATSVEEFRSMGILPEALLNFLTLLGWATGDDQEILSRTELESRFDLSYVNRSAAVFDVEKLLWMNGLYIGSSSLEELLLHLREHIRFDVDDEERLARVVELHKSQPKTLVELADAVRPYFVSDDQIEYEEQAARKHLKGAELKDRIAALREAFSQLDRWTVDSTDSSLRDVATRLEVGAGKLIHPLRLAVTGKGVAPPIFDVLAEMGKERTLSRLDMMLERLPYDVD
ncbi:MAG: glutamate--tRNA ligase, partial [Acidobacteria bacterium]|nr:glutamate--tRNA ligase [Acidobacteriota bacterium]